MSMYESAVGFVKELYGVQRELIRKRVNFGARLLMINIMLAGNATSRQNSVEITDGELMRYTGLSHTAITSNKRRLKNMGFIDFERSKSGTTYWLQDVKGAVEEV